MSRNWTAGYLGQDAHDGRSTFGPVPLNETDDTREATRDRAREWFDSMGYAKATHTARLQLFESDQLRETWWFDYGLSQWVEGPP